MSLQVWLPLNGTLENKGVANITTTSTPTYLDGKFGEGVSLTPRIDFSNLPKLNKFSIFFWVKVDSCSSDWADVIGFTSKQKDDASASDFRFEATKTNRACSFHNNSPFAITSGSRILITEAQKGTWHNVGVTYDGKTICSYIDGVKTYTDGGLEGYLINTFHIGETNSMVGVMNDLRIYDDVLSLAQIKEISKGLVLHYPLNSGYGNENLVVEGNKSTSWTIESSTVSQEENFLKVVTTSADKRIYRILNNVWTELGVYTVSFEAKADESGIIVDMSRSLTDFSTSFTLTTNWKRYVGYITTTATSTTGTLSYRMRSAGTTYIRNIKLEKGRNKFPVWSPSPSDELYSKMGYGSDIEYDVSGYNNNGIIMSNATYSTDSAVFDSSRTLNGTSQYLYSNKDMSSILNNEFSISFWVKLSAAPSESVWILNCGGINETDKFLHIAIRDTGLFSFAFYGDDYNSTFDFTKNLNQWVFVTCVYDKKSQHIYINGDLLGSRTITGTLNIPLDSKIFIGKRANGNIFGKVPYKLNDLRIYSSILSASDIKELYKTKAKIDKNGNIRTYMFNENNQITNLLGEDKWDYPTNFSQLNGTYTAEYVDEPISFTGKALKINCTQAGTGFYIGTNWNTAKAQFVNGEKYVWSMYIKSNTRNQVKFSVECCSAQTKSTFNIGEEYKRIESVFTYSNTTTYSAFSCYSNFLLDDDLYICNFCVEKYDPKTNLEKKAIFNATRFEEIKNSSAKIYKQDIVSNGIIEI